MREAYRLVHEFFTAVAAGELPDNLLTPDMTGWITTGGTIDKQTYQGLIKLLDRMSAEPLRYTIDAITAEGERALAEVRSEGTLVNGEPYGNTYVFAFRFRDGRIASVAEHYNALIVQEKLIPLMEEQGVEEEEAALVLGASGWQTFWYVTLPNIRWGLLYGVILSNARAMGEFGAVSVVSGHIRGQTNTIPLHVEILYNEYDATAAFAVASLLAFLALLTLAAKTFVEQRLHEPR